MSAVPVSISTLVSESWAELREELPAVAGADVDVQDDDLDRPAAEGLPGLADGACLEHAEPVELEVDAAEQP